MAEAAEMAAAAGLGAVVGWAGARRQLPAAVFFCLAVAVGAALFTSTMRSLDDDDGAAALVGPVVIASAILGAALAARAPSFVHGASWMAATVTAGASGALSGVDRALPAAALTVVVAVALWPHGDGRTLR